MKKRKIFKFILGLSSSILAAAIMIIFTPGHSWTEFAGWVIFMVAIQTPWMFFTTRKNYNCVNWFKKKNA
ncbi:MAG TPA: hypothetical protein VFP97_01380 [Chitinophagaceae bacterium]|nr:hypothetical protein [Chitinophagaceae bacterium]